MIVTSALDLTTLDAPPEPTPEEIAAELAAIKALPPVRIAAGLAAIKALPPAWIADIFTVADANYPEPDRLEAAQRLAGGRFARPFSVMVWEEIEQDIIAACREHAQEDETRQTVFRRAVRDAIYVTGIEASCAFSTVNLTIKGKPHRVKARRETSPPLSGLPVAYFLMWFCPRVRRQVLDILLPVRRDDERRADNRLSFVPFDEIPDVGLDAIVAQDASLEDARRVAEVFALASKQQRTIAHGVSLGWTFEEIAKEMGLVSSGVRVQWMRLIKKAHGMTA